MEFDEWGREKEDRASTEYTVLRNVVLSMCYTKAIRITCDSCCLDNFFVRICLGRNFFIFSEQSSALRVGKFISLVSL